MSELMLIGHINAHICILLLSRTMHLEIAAKYLNFAEVCR